MIITTRYSELPGHELGWEFGLSIEVAKKLKLPYEELQKFIEQK